MSRKAPHGTRARYAQGCRCAACKAENSSYQRSYRAAKATGTARLADKPSDGAKLVAFPRSGQVNQTFQQKPEVVVGDNERAVLAQTEASVHAAAQPAAVQQALSMARILDNPDCLAMHPTASRQLQLLLTSLDPPKPQRRKGRLAVVVAMTTQSVAK
jgi:hypothetical protein